MTPYRRMAPPAVLTSLLIVTAAAVATGDGRPAAAAKGTIAYTDSRGWRGHLWLMNLADGSKRQLTRSRYSEENPSWSPDGRRLAYVHTRHLRVPGLAARQFMPHIAVINVRTRSVRVLTGGNAYDGSPAWSPDGRQIAWARTTSRGGSITVFPEIWVMRRGGGGARRLTHNGVGDFAPAWSPNGKLIAFTRYRGQDTEARGIWVMRRGGKGERRLVRNGSAPAWSPDGRRIAYGRVTKKKRGCGCLTTDLAVSGARGRNRRLLVRNGDSPAWSPDGKRIVFQRVRDEERHLWTVNADGTGLRRLTAGSRSQRDAAWRPRR